MMSTIALKNTTKNAISMVISITGGTSSELIASAAYWPTPPMSNTASVTIAPPPMIAAKSRPQSEMTGISELRSTCRIITRRSESPFARAVRTKSSLMVSRMFERSRRE